MWSPGHSTQARIKLKVKHMTLAFYYTKLPCTDLGSLELWGEYYCEYSDSHSFGKQQWLLYQKNFT